MAEPRPPVAVRRILLALASSGDPLALETAAALAESLRAELEGLYIQDPDLARIAALPFAREVALGSAASRPLAAHQLERELRAQAAAVERLLRTRAGQRLKWSFTVIQGRGPAAALRERAEVDLFVLGRPPSPYGMPHGPDGGPLLLLYDGSASARRALGPAAALAAHSGRELLVLLAGREAGDVERLRLEGEQALAESDARVSYLAGRVGAPADLERIARTYRAALLLVAEEHLMGDEHTLHTLLERMPCPVVVAR